MKPPNSERRQVPLQQAAAETAATLLPDHPGPVLRGEAEDGIDYVCGKCGATIAERVIANQFFEFGVVCGHCSTLVSFDDLPAGRPLPSRTTVVLNDGKYRLSATINTGNDIVVAGEDAVRRRLHEVGPAGDPRSTGSTTLDEDFLREMVAEARQLLGDRYERLAASHLRGKQSPTPPKDPHRLLELIDAASAAADSFAGSDPAIDPVATAELQTALASFERWSNDPCWPSIVASLSNPSDYLHSVVLLVAASYLTDAGNGVELVRAPGTKRAADMRIHVTAQTAVNTEVKTPRALIRPEAPLTLDGARKIVQDQMSSAKSSAGGQLDPSDPGLLIIGGFGLREGDQTVLRLAARDELRRRGSSRGHVLGIALVSLGAVLESAPATAGGAVSLTGTAHTEIVLNQRYEGTIAVDVSQRPGLKQLSGSQQLMSEADEGEQLGRNDPCWCGSGKKFKRCHGA
jgi:hypothetical protein